MQTRCTPETKWYCESIMTHARQVLDFCRSNISRIEDLEGKEWHDAMQEFMDDATRLSRQLAQLVERSPRTQLSARLNHEQLEAIAAAVSELLDAALVELLLAS